MYKLTKDYGSSKIYTLYKNGVRTNQKIIKNLLPLPGSSKKYSLVIPNKILGVETKFFNTKKEMDNYFQKIRRNIL